MSARGAGRRRRRRRHQPVPGADPLVAPLNPELERNMTKNERAALNVHQHPISIWRPVLAALGLTVVMGIVMSDDRLPLPVLLAVAGAWGYVVWREVERRHNSFAATDRRVMMVTGLINKSVPMMRLGKVTDMRLDQPVVGRLLGYGTITIESAGQDQAIRSLRYAPYPTQTFRRLNETIFGDEYEDDENEGRGAPIPRLASWLADLTRRGTGAAATRASAAWGRRHTETGHEYYRGTGGRRRRGGATGQRPASELRHLPSGRDDARPASAPVAPTPLRDTSRERSGAPTPLRDTSRERSGAPTGEIPKTVRSEGEDR